MTCGLIVNYFFSSVVLDALGLKRAYMPIDPNMTYYGVA